MSYLNTLPFRWALGKSDILQNVEIAEDMPSICALKLLQGEVDLALVPVAVIPAMKSWHIQSRWCIGADGVVDSVKLYHDVPRAEIQQVLLDYQSRTSVNLARVLFEKAWKQSVRFSDAAPGFESKISGTTAGVVIGDRTFSLNGKFRYETDLAQAWKEFTGLPFVFAAWVSSKPLDESFMKTFDAVLAHGVKNTSTAVKELPSGTSLSPLEVEHYLTRRIDYRFDAEKRKAMALFHAYLDEIDKRR